MTIVQVKNLRKTYPLGKVLVEAVKGINFSIDSGEFVSISGPSGSGKSTTLNMIGLIDTPTSGELIINGETIYQEKDYLSFQTEKQGLKNSAEARQADHSAAPRVSGLYLSIL